MTLNEARGADQAAGVVTDETTADDADPFDEEDQVEEVWDLNDLSVQICHGRL